MYVKKLIILFFFNLVFISFGSDNQQLQLPAGLFIGDFAPVHVYPSLTFYDALNIAGINRATHSYYKENKQNIIKLLQPLPVYFEAFYPRLYFSKNFTTYDVDMSPLFTSYLLPFSSVVKVSNRTLNPNEQRVLLIGYTNDHAVMCVRKDNYNRQHTDHCHYYAPFTLIDKYTFQQIIEKYDIHQANMQKDVMVSLIRDRHIQSEEDLDNYYEENHIRLRINNDSHNCYVIDHVVTLKSLWEIKDENLHHEKMIYYSYKNIPDKSKYYATWFNLISSNPDQKNFLDGKLYRPKVQLSAGTEFYFKLPWSEQKKHYLAGIHLIQEQKKLAKEKAETQEKLKKSNADLAWWKKFWGCLLLGYVVAMSVIMYKITQQHGYIAKV